MKVKDIVKLTNTYLTGEQLVYQKLIPFYDAVIDDINSRLNSTYPSFSSLEFTSLEGDTAVYNYFPDRYVRSVVALGAAHKFYTMDETDTVDAVETVVKQTINGDSEYQVYTSDSRLFADSADGYIHASGGIG